MFGRSSTPTPVAETRPLILQHQTIRISIPICTPAWFTAEGLKEELLNSLSLEQPSVSEYQAEDQLEREVTLLSKFLRLACEKVSSESASTSSKTFLCSIIETSLRHFKTQYLLARETDLHNLVANFSEEARNVTMNSYYLATCKIPENLQSSPTLPISSLLEAAINGQAKLFAIFGGQGTNEIYFDELRTIFANYQPLVETFLTRATKEVLVPLSEQATLQGFAYYTQGCDVISWLQAQSSSPQNPSVSYLASIPLSLPLIGLTQLVRFLAFARASNVPLSTLRSAFKGVTGHSQGVISAVVLSSSGSIEEFETQALKALKLLFYLGLRGQEASPSVSIDPSIAADTFEGGEGYPSPMLSITSLGQGTLQKHIDHVNTFLDTSNKIQISLFNGPRQFVVTGPPKSLCGLVNALRKIKAPSGMDQSKIPFGKRKSVFTIRFLVIGVPYHSHYLERAVERVLKVDLKDEELFLSAQLKVPVFHTESGEDLSKLKDKLTQSLAKQILVLPIHWLAATNFIGATHSIDFGPGGLSGPISWTSRNWEGRGIQSYTLGASGVVGVECYNTKGLKSVSSWEQTLSPRLVKTSDGAIFLDTSFSRLLGKPPIMVAGMTPCTVKAGFNAAVATAGYHIELAGGAHYNAKDLRAKVLAIQNMVPAGAGLTLNALYINQRQFTFQLPAWQEMRREGLPIEGFCVAAGVPSSEKATEIITGLRQCGIKHISFKPGSVDGIRQVINIAAANPDFPVILQWTGGRAGGHHSCEDFHQPILSTYNSIRRHKNISLVAGSGFGAADDVWPYLSGDWSKDLYSTERMPFDGALFASRVMSAKEAHTSDSVKNLIVQASGCTDSQWEGTYDRETGGIVTVQSELGEPIHKIATRGVKLWREFDDTVFALPREKRAAWLLEKRDYVISRLNKDFQKPWFAQKSDGRVVHDVAEMTYEEVARRMLRLLYVQHQARWIDISLRRLLGDWLRRTEERFVSNLRKADEYSLLQSYDDLDDPENFLNTFFKVYLGSCVQLLGSEDKSYFLALCQRTGQKPVPFIPVLDATFEVWFKKDSLWQAEDVDAVFDQDPQRVCCLQGPVAVRHTKKANEPIKELLGGIDEQLKSFVLKRFYNNDISLVPEVEYVGAPQAEDTQTPDGVQRTHVDGTISYSLGEKLPTTEDWLQILVSKCPGWLRSLVFEKTVVQRSSFADNPMKKLLAPRKHQRALVAFSASGKFDSLSLFGSIRSICQEPSEFKALEIRLDSENIICVTLFEECQGRSVPLRLLFKYMPSQAYAPIHEIMEDRNNRIKEFYWKLWDLGSTKEMYDQKFRSTFTAPNSVITQEVVERFCSVVGNQCGAFQRSRQAEPSAPLDIAIVAGWKAIMKAIFPIEIDGDLLKLVHVSNGFQMVKGAKPLKAGDSCSSKAIIISVKNTDSGKLVKVKGSVTRDDIEVVTVTSTFLYRGTFDDFENTFDVEDNQMYTLIIKDEPLRTVLSSKEWFHWDADQELKVGDQLNFNLKSEVRYKSQNRFASIIVSGIISKKGTMKEDLPVGIVDLSIGASVGNPVIEFLKRHGLSLAKKVPFADGGYAVAPSTSYQSPTSNEPYSKISGDFNPIHVNPYFSDYAGLPGTITHGLWSSAAARAILENVAAQDHPERVISYTVSFIGMVLPQDTLDLTLRHVGMQDGNKIFSVSAKNQLGEVVMAGEAEVSQPSTVYVFTGQGSQEPGMGMELYDNSPAARAVWDAADEHLTAVYGFSIVEIVKNNPKEKTVHFGGLKGQNIRERYMQMTYDTHDKNGNIRTLPLFPDIGIRTTDYTFSSPTGLLFATQFAQIALVVTEKAAFEDLRSKGFIQTDCAFAGHSLGEYAALSAIADIMPISSLTDVVFFRGLTMQRAVERDAQNRSAYAMVAVNPSRISPSFSEIALKEVVESISKSTGKLLEVVNLNIVGQQYVVAGELAALQCLTNVLNLLKVQKIDISKLASMMTLEEVQNKLKEIVEGCYSAALEKQEPDGWIQLERGFATIPLPGIDVPFHSRYLWAGVLPFRTYLSKKINSRSINPEMLIGRYIPNLTAKPFEVSQDYAQLIYNQTSSPRLDRVLKFWERDSWGAKENFQKLAYTILVELLAYQFASPVRWIETQDLLFNEFNFERLIELGPSPTLTGMAVRTQKLKYDSADSSINLKRAILCHAKHPKEVYYQYEDPVEDALPEEIAPSTPAQSASTSAIPAAPAFSPSALSSATAIPDEPMKALDTLKVIIAQKLKKNVTEIPVSKSIKELVGGKSTLQNEILGDLQAEFPSPPEKGEEMPLDELAAALGVGYSGQMGKHSGALVSRLIGGKMPGGFTMTSIKTHLSRAWGLEIMRSDALILLATTMEPPKRLGSDVEAKAWLDDVAKAYASNTGLSLSSTSSGGLGSAAGPSGGPVINSEQFEAFEQMQNSLAAQQIELYTRYLKASRPSSQNPCKLIQSSQRDSRVGHRLFDLERANNTKLQSRVDAITREHGDAYLDGIQPVFTDLKARSFDSSWNWVRQDAFQLVYEIIFGRLTSVDREITSKCLTIINRASPALVDYMQYFLKSLDPAMGDTYRLAKDFGQQLLENCKEALNEAPMYKDVTFPTAPSTEVNSKGDIVYTEITREGVRKLEAYVKEMASGGKITQTLNLDKVHSDVAKLWKLIKAQPQISRTHKASLKSLYGEVVRSLGKQTDARRLTSKSRRSSSQFQRPAIIESLSLGDDKLPFLHLKRKVGSSWQYSSKLTSVYLDILQEIATSGTSFKQKHALLTGVGKGSIGVEIVKGLLAGGANVVITTSRYSRATVEYYQALYQECGSRGSSLHVVPFNQASRQDVEALIEFIYTQLGFDLDYVLPFAALPENGREIDGIDDKSELAHRVMLTNVIRLLGAIKTKKASRHSNTRPTQVVLPLSPNHGLFGNDGLYSESKISLETLFNRWSSESWGEYICIAGAVIGWTRGTGLMSATNIVAQGVESYGVRTFSAKEMAFNILGLMHPLLFDVTQIEPIWADLNGGMDRLPELAQITTNLRKNLMDSAAVRRALAVDNALDFTVMNGVEAERIHQKVPISSRANFKFTMPNLDTPQSFGDLSQLQGMIDLEKVIVVTGFAEVGPWGSSRTRWEMEARGEFTIEGSIEMAWIMGLIKPFDGKLKAGQHYVGWVDAQTLDPVEDKDVKGKYDRSILDHAGIRLIEPELFRGFDPEKKGFHQEIQLVQDMEPIEVSEVEAHRFKHEHGDKCDIWSKSTGSDEYFVKLCKGARILVPKAVRLDRSVAGQIPTGWHAGRYGIPEDIIAQTDRTALWALVCTAEALISSGITDAYELYKYVHPSEVGSCLGSGMGGMQSLQAMFKDRKEEKDVQKDILQETFINSVAGWVNLLLLSASGPIKIPTGACATALQSLEIACDTILSGKAKVMIAGGYDDFSEEGCLEFANMGATSNADNEFAMGREPSEMSRPMTSTRSGFMEAQGTGVQVIMNAKTALQMGATIRGIIAYTATSSDKAGRSIPAPGRGVLGNARQVPTKYPSSLLSMEYQARQLTYRKEQISQWLNDELDRLRVELDETPDNDELSGPISDELVQEKASFLEEEAQRQVKSAQATFGMLEGSDPRIAPVRRALAVWGLSIDDVGVCSLHGTSTKANDKNESSVYNDQFSILGRSKGNACPVISQKYLTGHPKGGAAAWMMNGLIQSINDSVIPGNRNADNISSELQAFEYLLYLSKTVKTDGIKCGMLTSFGFGQVGGQAIIVHPSYLYASMTLKEYEQYVSQREIRAQSAYRKMSESFIKENLVVLKEEPPYDMAHEAKTLLNPLARAAADSKGSYSFNHVSQPQRASLSEGNFNTVSDMLKLGLDCVEGVGVDAELISAFPVENPTFLDRNYTAAEMDYCWKQPHPAASFAARWAGKEAVFKSLHAISNGAGAPMHDIEIVSTPTGPEVRLHGEALQVANSKGLKSFAVTLSHSEDTAIAMAVAKKT